METVQAIFNAAKTMGPEWAKKALTQKNKKWGTVFTNAAALGYTMPQIVSHFAKKFADTSKEDETSNLRPEKMQAKSEKHRMSIPGKVLKAAVPLVASALAYPAVGAARTALGGAASQLGKAGAAQAAQGVAQAMQGQGQQDGSQEEILETPQGDVEQEQTETPQGDVQSAQMQTPQGDMQETQMETPQYTLENLQSEYPELFEHLVSRTRKSKDPKLAASLALARFRPEVVSVQEKIGRPFGDWFAEQIQMGAGQQQLTPPQQVSGGLQMPGGMGGQGSPSGAVSTKLQKIEELLKNLGV